jgi:hypothetical protein
MNTLLFDVCRCKPEIIDDFCRNCKRWLHHPEQVVGPRTPIVSVETSASEACMYMPIGLQGQSGSASPGLQGRLSRR